MRLVPKLTLGLVLGMSLLLAANGVLRVRREVATFQTDRVRDHQILGRALASAAASTWRSDGRERALAVVRETDARSDRIRVRWVTSSVDARDQAATSEAARTHEPVTAITEAQDGVSRRYTYVPVLVGGTVEGFLELSEALDVERRYVRATIWDTVFAALAMALVSGVLAGFLGSWLVGRPVRLLVDKARRTGRGDFSSPVELRSRDELAEVGDEMNVMAEQLVVASERVRTETEARITMLEQLRHADRLATVGKLASGIAHELGTPLNVISARASMLVSEETTAEEVRDYAGVIVAAAERMTKIIRQLLEFARRKGPERAGTDLRRMASDTLDMMIPIARKRGVSLVLEDGAPVPAAVDVGQIQQALTNLVVNAVHASPSGATVEVRVLETSARPKEHPEDPAVPCTEIEVTDHGSGIPKEHIDKIFEPFFTTKEVGEGTGLGLSVTYGIVADHGGWFDIDTSARGTAFRIFLPTERAA